MELRDKVIVVTGGGSGIGQALCERFVTEGARAVVVADRDGHSARTVADQIGAEHAIVDVADELAVQELVAAVLTRHGRVDLFCSNAGVAGYGGPEAPDEVWDLSWRVNVMAHVYAARATLPAMRNQGGGYLLQTVSAAGLLGRAESAPYTVAKHAALGFAEALAVRSHRDRIRVSALCPERVDTPLLATDPDEREGRPARSGSTLVMPADVAEAAVRGIERETFLITTHKHTLDLYRSRAADPDRWVARMAANFE